MKKSGFTLVEIMIVVAIIGLLAAIAIPSFVKARTESQKNGCINNLRIIDAGKEQAALAYKVAVGGALNVDSTNEYIKGSTTPECPAGGTYDYKPIGTNPDCQLAADGHVLPN